MKCTSDCEWWRINANNSRSLTPPSFCGGCGSPLLPDPVESVEWKIIKAGTNGHIIDVMACDDERESGRILNDNAAAYPHYIHTLKSVTTIERVIKIVRPAVVALLLLTGCATSWPRHCQPGCRCDKLDTSEVCSLRAGPAWCACRDYPRMRL